MDFGTLLSWLIVGGLILFLFRGGCCGPTVDRRQSGDEGAAGREEIFQLKARLTRGEIGIEEYERLRAETGVGADGKNKDREE